MFALFSAPVAIAAAFDPGFGSVTASANFQSVTFIRWFGVAVVVVGLGIILLRKWRDR